MNKTVDTFIALVKSAMTGGTEDIDFCSVDFAALYSLSDFHDLAHIIFYELKRRNALPDGNCSQQFKERYDSAVFRYFKKLKAIEQVRRAFETDGVPFILLKGSALMGLYPEEWMRTSCDVDVLVKENDRQKAALALTSAGLTRRRTGSHDDLFETAEHYHIELHFILIEDYRFPKAAQVLKRVWEFAYPVGPAGAEYRMNDEMFYFYHVAHMVKHFQEGGCGVRTFLDLWLLNDKVPFDRQTRELLLAQGGIITFEKRTKELAEYWFSEHSGGSVNNELAEYVIYGGAFGTPENRAASMSGRTEQKGIKYYFYRLFPPKAEMKGRYPILKEKRFLMPVYRVKRVFSLLNPRVRKIALSELKAEKNLDSHSMEKTVSLMKQLEVWQQKE